MEQILLADSLLKETVAAIMMLCKNVKVKVCSADGDIVAGVLQEVCLDYVLNERKQLQAGKKRRYPEQTITDEDYADDIALLSNSPTQAESLLHSLEQIACGIGLHLNIDKTKYM